VVFCSESEQSVFALGTSAVNSFEDRNMMLDLCETKYNLQNFHFSARSPSEVLFSALNFKASGDEKRNIHQRRKECTESKYIGKRIGMLLYIDLVMTASTEQPWKSCVARQNPKRTVSAEIQQRKNCPCHQDRSKKRERKIAEAKSSILVISKNITCQCA